MKTSLKKIEELLRSNPQPCLPEELYAKLQTDLFPNINAANRASTYLSRQWSRHLAMIILLIAVTIFISGAGIYYYVQYRYDKSEEVPAYRLRDVTDPYIPPNEDLLPISPALYENILDLRPRVESHQAETGLKGKWALLDVQPDGTAFIWWEGGTELMEATDYLYHANQHPNDYRGLWQYNLDDSPILIKSVEPHYARQGEFGDLQDGGMSYTDGYNQRKGYLVEMEKPKGDVVIDKILNKLNQAELIDGRWRLELDNFFFGGAGFVFLTIKLPDGAKKIESSRPFTEQLHAKKDQRKRMVFAEELPAGGHFAALEITYELKNKGGKK